MKAGYTVSVVNSQIHCNFFKVSPASCFITTHTQRYEQTLHGIVNALIPPCVCVCVCVRACFVLSFAIYSNLDIISFSFIRIFVLQVKIKQFSIPFSDCLLHSLRLPRCYHIATWRYASLFMSRFHVFLSSAHILSFLLNMVSSRFTLTPSSISRLCRHLTENLLLHMPFDIRLIGISYVCLCRKFK